MSELFGELIEMVCPKCSGSGKQGKKEDCDLCAGQCYVSLAVHDEHVAKQHDQHLEECQE